MPEIEHRKVCNDLTLSALPARLRLAFPDVGLEMMKFHTSIQGWHRRQTVCPAATARPGAGGSRGGPIATPPEDNSWPEKVLAPKYFIIIKLYCLLC